MSDFTARSDKPVSVCWPATPAGAIARLAERGIHCAIEPARSANAMGRLLRHHAARNRPARDRNCSATVRLGRACAGRDRLSAGYLGRPVPRLLQAAGLPVAAGALATDEAAALAYRR